ncbi:hypothetical protein Tco_0881260 [Tanacetum coccineum]
MDVIVFTNDPRTFWNIIFVEPMPTQYAVLNPFNTTYRLFSRLYKYKTLKLILAKMKVIKEENKVLGLIKIDDDLFTCDTPLRMMFNEFSRLSGMDDDLFTYEVEIHKFSYFPSVEQQMDDLDNGYLDVYERKVCYDECEKIYAEAVIFINKRLVRLIDVTIEQWLDLK